MRPLYNLLRPRRALATAGSADWPAGFFASELAAYLTSPEGKVLVWAIKDDATTATVTDQFKGHAQEYHRRYAASDHFEQLFRQALSATGARIAERPAILDLGSGSGVNSVVPCQRLFPGARIIATDLSAELLAMLADYLVEQGTAADVRCVRMDAMSEHVAPGTFDLVTGASILHHLDKPERGIAAAARALRPGGHAIFFEPFHGWAIVRLAFERILAEGRLREAALEAEVALSLEKLIEDVRMRSILEGRSAPAFAAMDDKWLFSETRVKAAARAAGFSEARFAPHNDHASLYRDSAMVHLRLTTGRDDLVLPPWAVAILDDFDAAMPLHAKRELMLEGTIILTK